MADRKDALPNRVCEAFADKEILLTGGTGFLGKVLLEKLLRTCSGLRKVYILVRPKKGKEPQERVRDILNAVLFDKFRSESVSKNALKKVCAISGDVSLPDLGLSMKDRQMLCHRVGIVFHCAATVRFDEPLKTAVLLNTRGTKLLLDLARHMEALQCFVHVSTAYCHPEQKVLDEKMYPPPHNPHEIIKFVESMDDSFSNALTMKLLNDIPNTYVYTKALAESLCEEQMDELPITILRPSIVVPIWREPLPGWTDNINGVTGLVVGAGKGVIRSMYCSNDYYADYVPADIVANATIITTWDFIEKRGCTRNVYNLTSSSEVKIPWSKMHEICFKVTEKIPFNNVVWYPSFSILSSRLLHNIYLFLFQIIPAIFLDGLLCLIKYKPVLMRVQHRVFKGLDILEYYANHQWEFKNENILRFREILNEREIKVFNIESTDFTLQLYLEDCAKGARLHLFNETVETLPSARRHLKIMYWVDKITKLLLLYFLLRSVCLLILWNTSLIA